MSDVTIRVEGLGKQYRRGSQKQGRLIEWLRGQTPYEYFWALQDMSFEVARGEMLGVIGANGAGKSTLLRILSRITRPTVGRAEVFGRIGSLLDVGTGFHPELTGRENVFLNGTVLGIPRTVIRDQLDQIIEFSEIGDFIDTPLKYYSSGMKVRLGVSVSVNLPQTVMLVDEVLAVGDAAFREKCLDRVAQVTKSGRTVMFVGHNMEMISSTCDRAIWLRKGRLHAEGPAPEVVQAYQEEAIKAAGMDGLLPLDDLADHGHQRGLRLTHMRLLNGDGQQIEAFRTGQAVKIAVGFEGDGTPPPKDVTVGITLSGHARVALFHCENTCVGRSFETVGSAGEFMCSIDRLPLTPGRYSLGVSCSADDEVIHGVPHVGLFNVLDGDYYDTGRLPPVGSGNVLTDYSWSLEKAFTDGHRDSEND